jgi:hypothetical protein
MFPRTYVAKTDKITPQDSQSHQLFALNADPLTAMVNSNRTFQLKGETNKNSNKIRVGVTESLQLSLGLTVIAKGVLPENTTITHINVDTGVVTVSHEALETRAKESLTFTDFAGLGLSYLSSSALFVQPSEPFLDPPPPYVPEGQPLTWANPQAPGAERWQYRYDGNGNPREYQDFSIGLQGVQADGKVLSYSDWTVTMDWQGTDNSGRAQELQATLGEGLPFAYFTAPTSTDANGTTIQLVTTPKTNIDPKTKKPVPVPVTVTAYDSTGHPVKSGTGPFELEISYTVHDVLDNITQRASTNGNGKEKNELTVVDATQLAAGMSVVGEGIKPGTTITKIVDATHITISTTPATLHGVNLTFNSHSERTFDNFYGIYLPTGIPWEIASKDSSGDVTLTAKLTAKNYFSVATLPGGSQGAFNPVFTTFLPHAYTFVTGSTSSFNFNQSTGIVTTTYALQTNVMQAVPGTSDTGPLQALNATQ